MKYLRVDFEVFGKLFFLEKQETTMYTNYFFHTFFIATLSGNVLICLNNFHLILVILAILKV